MSAPRPRDLTTVAVLEWLQGAIDEANERDGIVEEAGRPKPPPFHWYTATEIAEPLPALPWLVPGLGLAPGAPAMFAGYGYSRKTLAMQDLALGVATGGSVWGVFHSKRGKVLHLDYEQGRRLTAERYQRLARARDIDLTEFGDALRLAVFPRLSLATARAEADLCRACEGVSLVVVDSFRAACPGVDENNSEARAPLDLLGRVSERTGAVCAVIHHARKPSENGGAEGARYTVRGSGAIYDACSSVYVFSGPKGEPTKVHHEKDRHRGSCLEDFGLDAIDVAQYDDPRWGLRVVHLEGEQVEPKKRAERRTGAERIAHVEELVLDCLLGNPGVTKREIRELIDGVRGQTVDVALMRLLERGQVANRGTQAQAKYFRNEAQP